MNFPCTRCGECCKPAWATQGLLPTKEDGSCAHLVEGEGCSIYEDRPDLCRIDKTHEMVAPEMTRGEFYEHSAKLCNQLVRQAGLGDEFLVRIGA